MVSFDGLFKGRTKSEGGGWCINYGQSVCGGTNSKRYAMIVRDVSFLSGKFEYIESYQSSVISVLNGSYIRMNSREYGS